MVSLACPVQGESSQNRRHSPVGPRHVKGWPVILGNRIAHTPAIADINGDGSDEVAVGLRDGRIFLLEGDGRILPGWPQVAENEVRHSPLFIDLDEDDELEILGACMNGFLYAWRKDGSTLPNWPVNIHHAPASAPQIVPFRSEKDFCILVACGNGTVYLLDRMGNSLQGWPKHAARIRADGYDCYPVQWADLDRDGIPEILVLTYDNAILHVWRLNGENYPGFPLAYDRRGVGIAVNNRHNPTHIAFTTNYEIITLDSSGSQVFRFTLPDDDDRFFTSPAFISIETDTSENREIISAGTVRGKAYLVDDNGHLLPEWPVQLGGFIYGLTESQMRCSICCAPQAWDADDDGELDILVASSDQHLYCFDLEGKMLQGWPLTLDDQIKAGPIFAQLDGLDGKEMVVGQFGEAIFAYHLNQKSPARSVTQQHDKDLYSSKEWPKSYFIVSAAITIMLVLHFYLVRRRQIDAQYRHRLGVGSWLLIVFVAALIVVRAILFAYELRHYADIKARMYKIEPIVEHVLAKDQARVQELTEDLAAALDSCDVFRGRDQIQILYQMERLADRYRLDYKHFGLMITDEQGRTIQALGLARGWIHLHDLNLPATGTTKLIVLGDIPVHVGCTPLGAGNLSGHFFLFSSLLNNLPYTLSDATGFSTHIRLRNRTLAWGGRPPVSGVQVWPWLGFIEPARTIPIPTPTSDTQISLRLAAEDFPRSSSAWIDPILIIALLFLFYVFVLRNYHLAGIKQNGWWLLLFAVIYALGWILFSQQDLIQRPVPFAGHIIEFFLHLMGLTWILFALHGLAGRRRGRRLSAVLIGSYLIVSLLPLLLVLFITTRVIQQTQRRVMQNIITELEDRAENLTISYMASYPFLNNLRSGAKALLDQPTEAGYLNFVSDNQYLFTYDYPSAYITLSVSDASNPTRQFTGFSWRAPRTQKFFSPLPNWMEKRNQKGIFVDGGRAVARATRTIHFQGLEAFLISHIPFDKAILSNLEEKLRILPFLPKVRLQAAWLTSKPDIDRSAGWILPLRTKLVLPARDWRTGAPRWIVYQASAFLPAGREMWSVLSTLILLAFLPLALSFWGAYFTFQRTVRPLTRLLTGIRRVGTGDLEYRLADSGQTEIAVAARAFDKMTVSLKTKIQELAEKKKIEEISELKSSFISMVSHDLKTPLASIKGASENLLAELAGPVTNRQRKYLEMIISSSENLKQMIVDLLDLSHIESGQLILNLESLDLKREVDNVLRSVQPLLDEKKMATSINVRAGDTRLKADRTRLWQILSNVISNSIRYSPNEKQIRIVIEDVQAIQTGDRGGIQTSIIDQGPGFPEEERTRLFEPFYSRPAGPKGKRGAGLGLAIVKQLVELHGGKVSIANQDEGGACFNFTLPQGDIE
jgi:signal transduction histidine kinase